MDTMAPHGTCPACLRHRGHLWCTQWHGAGLHIACVHVQAQPVSLPEPLVIDFRDAKHSLLRTRVGA